MIKQKKNKINDKLTEKSKKWKERQKKCLFTQATACICLPVLRSIMQQKKTFSSDFMEMVTHDRYIFSINIIIDSFVYIDLKENNKSKNNS